MQCQRAYDLDHTDYAECTSSLILFFMFFFKFSFLFIVTIGWRRSSAAAIAFQPWAGQCHCGIFQGAAGKKIA